MRLLIAFLAALRVVNAPDRTPQRPSPVVATPEAAAAVRRGEMGYASTPLELSWRDTWAALRRVRTEASSDGLLLQASAVAFYLALAVVPLAVVAVSLFGLLAGPATVEATLSALAALPGGAGELLLQPASDAASADSGSLGLALVAGLATGLWTASAGTKSLMGAIGVAYDETEDRGFLRLRGTAVALTLALLATLGGAVFAVARAESVARGLGVAGWIGDVVRFPVLLVAIVLLLAVLYRYGPDRSDARWAWVTPGALVAAFAWLLVTAGFTFYVETFGSYDETYGSLAGVVVLLLWLQLTAATFLLGAEVNAELERQTVADTTTGPARPMGQRGAVPADYPPGVEPQDVGRHTVDA